MKMYVVCTHHCDCHEYTQTIILKMVSDRNISSTEITIQRELEIVSDWLIDNKLSLHLGKKESILFGSSPRLKIKSAMNISCKGTSIEAKVKYLGAVLEQCISGENTVTSIILSKTLIPG